MSMLLSSGPGFVYRDGGIELEPDSVAVVQVGADDLPHSPWVRRALAR